MEVKSLSTIGDRIIHPTITQGIEKLAPPKYAGLLLDRLHTLPSTTKLLLPQADSVVTRADGQDVAAQAPAHPPCYSADIEGSGFPFPYIFVSALPQNRASSCAYVDLRTSRCAPSCPGSLMRYTTWKEQSVTRPHRAPSLCVPQECCSSGRFRSPG